MKRTLTVFLGLLAALWFPAVSSAQSPEREDMFSLATHGYGSSRFAVNVFGRNQDSDTTQDTVWEGSDVAGPIRCFTIMGTTAQNLYISSDDEDDGSDNNAVSVTVEALDANWDPVTIVAPLGAASASGTVFAQVGTTTLMRVNRAYVTTGSTAPEGNIYIGIDDADGGTDGVPDTILTDLVAVIIIGENQTNQACYTVPNDYNGFLTQFCSTNIDTAANATGTFRLRSATNGGASLTQESLVLAETTYQCTSHAPPVYYPEKTDIEITNTSSANNASVYGSFDLVLISNAKSGL